ncbi:MAG: DUF2937 family protein, partial [Pseudomonadota bacterium]|nr:DUF2937 family protein [Pseudomonadota bacterium]
MELLLRRLALAVGLACGLIGTQAPEFAQQYRQRLAGAVDELSRVVATFDAEARARDFTPDQAIARLEGNADPLARERGRAMAGDKARLARLEAALDAYASAGPVRRLAATVATLDAATARRAWGDFQPAVPTTFEALAVGGLGGALGWLAAH